MRSPLYRYGLLALSIAFAQACSAGSDDAEGGGGEGAGSAGPNGGSTATGFQNGSTNTGTIDDCIAAAKLIYVVSVDYTLYSFDPDTPGIAAYKPVGPLSCPSAAAPQSMAVSRDGTAYVFYDSGELFQVSTADASCQATSYVHPVQQGFNQLGMGFTATAPDSTDEQLYIVSPAFGLATVAIPSFDVTQTGMLVGAAELTGGPDAKLFHFAAGNAQLGEVGLTSGFGLMPIHTFNELAGTAAWAFSRYAGKFYMFTSPGAGIPSTTTEYDPAVDVSTVRDANIGFTIVGAGQSTCVPPPPPT
ncbi:MAG: hypothetical protein HOV80_34500 [Polyangiaceae bacterium]|nr:hypothetical protein [Polyangiaceae bacterium]